MAAATTAVATVIVAPLNENLFVLVTTLATPSGGHFFFRVFAKLFPSRSSSS